MSKAILVNSETRMIKWVLCENKYCGRVVSQDGNRKCVCSESCFDAIRGKFNFDEILISSNPTIELQELKAKIRYSGDGNSCNTNNPFEDTIKKVNFSVTAAADIFVNVT